ncbi:prolyl oligopeptidase family serine peptidase, partial [Glaciecola sp. SC05]|uniref:prolyl oligopeptidase family serine peptidase n=1 Tax=Glaciecola sp. SC05 TaxID=1987355 RepID=UPI003529B974
MSILLILLFSVSSGAQHVYVKSEDLFVAPSHKMGQLSADGKFFSYIKYEDGQQYLEFANLENYQSASVLALPKQSRLKSYTWLKHNTMHMVLMNRNQSIEYIVNIATEDVLAGKQPQVDYYKLPQGYVVSVLQDNPEQVMFARAKENDSERRHSLYKIDIEDLKNDIFSSTDLIDQGDEDLVRYFYDDSYQRIIGVFYDVDSDQIILSFRELANKAWQTIITYEDQDFNMSPIGFLGANEVAVLTNKQTDTVVLQSYNFKSQELGEILYQHDLYDLTDATLSANGELLSVEYIQSGLPQTEWVINSGNRLASRLAKTFENGVPVIIDASEALERNLIFVAGSDNPGEYFLYEKAVDKIVKLIDKYPQLSELSFPVTESFKVKLDDATNIEAFITKPSGLDLNTLLVMPHGGPIGVRDYSFFTPDIQYLVNRGFTVLRVNFRGSSGYGKAFLDSGRGEFGQLIEQDISKVVEQVIAKNNYDNICAIGASYGAYSSMMLAIKHPEIYQCVVASYGIYDLPLLFNYSNYRTGEAFQETIAKVVGEYSPDKKEQSPVYFADKLNVPVLIIAGKNDIIAGFEQSNRMRYMLDKFGKEVEHIFYKNSGHGHSNWYLDRHESAYIVDYLYRKLNIEAPFATDLDGYSAQALAYDNLIIADELDHDKHIAQDRARAFDYLQRASAYGNPRAIFNEGAHYHRGDQVDFDIQRAISLYERSLELGHDGAYRRLGQMYLEGVYVDKNDEKALSYLKTANEKDDSFSNKLILARLHCIAAEPIKNVDKCIAETKKVAPDKGKGKDIHSFRAHLAEMVVRGNYTSSEQKLVSDFVIEQLDLSSSSFELEIKEEGLFTLIPHERFGRRGEFELAELQTMSLYEDTESVNGMRFGVRFEMDTPGFSTRKDQTLVITKLESYGPDGRLLSEKIAGNKRTSLYDVQEMYRIEDYISS